MIRRRGMEAPSSDDDDDEEDAFTTLSRKNTKRPKNLTKSEPLSVSSERPEKPVVALPTPVTSSMRRHHLPNDMRKAKMDALLDELKEETKQLQQGPAHEVGRRMPGGGRGGSFVPEKKGSFVEPGEEHLTTNIFVGNLSPSITEEQLTDLFSQFGDLYSIKIMWPRTPAERSRNRNTGFVCFMNREDAEEAMEACSETDPFNVGRLLMMRWGKNVKKTVRRGTGGGIAIAPIRKKSAPTARRVGGDLSVGVDMGSFGEEKGVNEKVASQLREGSGEHKYETYQLKVHGKSAIRVAVPPYQHRVQFISTIASFVATDGYSFERMLIQTKAGDPAYKFLTYSDSDETQKKENIFYRWRVYSFCQGDGQHTWKTDPFVMFHPHGSWWIPPSVDEEAARREEYNERRREESKVRQKKERRLNLGRRGYVTGRQLERLHSRGPNTDGAAKLSKADRQQFDLLVKRKLSISRSSICEAMAFCYEKSWAAKDISSLLKLALLEEGFLMSIDTRVARLYLLSDILFNSQQPGVRNAFLYRSAIEAMAPEVFRSLGRHGGGTVGRLTMNKLRNAVSSVLAAWTEWSVYSPTFMDELEAYFEGREMMTAQPKDEEKKKEIEAEKVPETTTGETPAEEKEPVIKPVEISSDKPLGNWEEVDNDEPENYQKYSKRDDGEFLDGSEIGSEDLMPMLHSDDGYSRKERSANVTTDESVETEKHRNGGNCIKNSQDSTHGKEDADSNSRKHKYDTENRRIDGSGAAERDADDVDGESLVSGDIDGSSLKSEEFSSRGSYGRVEGSTKAGHKTPSSEYLEGNEVGVDGESLVSGDIDGSSLKSEDLVTRDSISGTEGSTKVGDNSPLSKNLDGYEIGSSDVDLDKEIVGANLRSRGESNDSIDGSEVDEADLA